MTEQTKSKLATDLEGMAPEQFAKVAETVEAERAKRDNGASEEEYRRNVSRMDAREYREHIFKTHGYYPSV